MRYLYINSFSDKVELRATPPTPEDLKRWKDGGLEVYDITDSANPFVLMKVQERAVWCLVPPNRHISTQMLDRVELPDLDLWDERANAVEAEDDECQSIRRYLGEAVAILRVLLSEPAKED